MTNKELAAMAERFTNFTNCYLKGFWGQKITKAEYDRVNAMYNNDRYNNQKYIGTDCFAFDCICFVKALLAGATPQRRLTYSEMKSNPLGDCSNPTFYEKLYDCLGKEDEIPAGYGVASTKHAALTLGNNRWIDCNFTGTGQDGLAIHTGNPAALGYKVGKIPGVTYESPEPEPIDEKAVLERFAKWAINEYLNAEK